MSNNTTKGFSNNYAEFQAYAAKGKQRERSESFDSDCIIVECLKKEKIADGSKDACVESKTVAGYIEIDSDYDDVIVYQPVTPVASTSKLAPSVESGIGSSAKLELVSKIVASTSNAQTKPVATSITSSSSGSAAKVPTAGFPIAGQSFSKLEEARDAIVLAATGSTGITYYSRALGAPPDNGKDGTAKCKARIILSRLPSDELQGVISPWIVKGNTIITIHNHRNDPKFIRNPNWRPKTRHNRIPDPRDSFGNGSKAVAVTSIKKVGKLDEVQEPLVGRKFRNGRFIPEEDSEDSEEDDEEDNEDEEREEESGDESEEEQKEEEELIELPSSNEDLDNIKKERKLVKEEIIEGVNIRRKTLNSTLSFSRSSIPAQPSLSPIKRPRSESVTRPRTHRSHLPTPSTSSRMRSPVAKIEELLVDILPPTPYTLVSLPQLQSFLFHINPLLRNLAQKLHRNGLDNTQTLINLVAGSDVSFKLFLDYLKEEEDVKKIPSLALKNAFAKLRDDSSVGFSS